MKSPGGNNNDTSWAGVADWYEDHLKGDDTYHAKVIAPNLMRIVGPKQGMNILDLACGEGYFSRMFRSGGAEVTGVDLAQTLIQKAKQESPDISYVVADATKDWSFAPNNTYDVVVCVLALQNMERLDPVFKECAGALKNSGKLVFVINHPAFRIPKHSSWGWDETNKVQYRRIDSYLSTKKEKIDMSPSKGGRDMTWSFHRSLQEYMKALTSAGFAVTKMEEWISHKKSEKGPREDAENTARKEFPLFLLVEARPQMK